MQCVELVYLPIGALTNDADNHQYRRRLRSLQGRIEENDPEMARFELFL